MHVPLKFWAICTRIEDIVSLGVFAKKDEPRCAVPLTFAVRLKHLTVLGGNLEVWYIKV